MSLAQERTEEVYAQVLIKSLNFISVAALILNIGFNPIAFDFFATSLVGVFSFILGGYCLFLSRSQRLLEIQWSKHFFITFLPIYFWGLFPVLAYANDLLQQMMVTHP